MVEGFDKWIIEEEGLERVRGRVISQMYVLWDANGTPVLVVAKVTEDLLMTGSADRMRDIAGKISERFELRKVIVDYTVTYNGLDILENRERNI